MNTTMELERKGQCINSIIERPTHETSKMLLTNLHLSEQAKIASTKTLSQDLMNQLQLKWRCTIIFNFKTKMKILMLRQ